MDVENRDDVAVDFAHQHHPGDVESLGIGDPEPVLKNSILTESFHHVTDLRTSSVDHDGQHANLAEQHDI